MLLDRVSNPGSLTYESGALPIALRGPASSLQLVFRTRKNEGLVIVYSRMKAGVRTDSSSVGVQDGIAKLIDQRLFHQLPHKFLNSHFTISTSIPVAM